MIEPTDEMLDAHEQARRAYWDALDADTGEGGMTVAEHERVARRQAMAAALEVVEPERSIVDPADLRIVLDQRIMHCHKVPGRWDSGGRPCMECAARARLREALP